MIIKDKTIKLIHSLTIITICLLLAASFIFLSSRKLNDDIELTNQITDVNDIYGIWNKNPKYKTKEINVSFQYDTRQVDDMKVINYQITNKKGKTNITQKEVNVLLDCYKNNNCEDKNITQKTKYMINNYKHFIIKDDMIVVYGLTPIKTEKSFGEIESNVFVINKNLFANIVNPVYSDTNRKYNNIRKKFLVNNASISYEDYSNPKRKAKKEEMINDATNEIMEGKAMYVKSDLDLLKIIAKSVQLMENEKN